MNIQIKIEILLPFYTWTIVRSYEGDFDDVPFGQNKFTLKVLDSNEDKNFMNLEISWAQILETKIISEDAKKRIVENAINFINHIIYHARTYDLETSNLVLVSPRIVKDIKILIESNGEILINEREQLKLEPPQYFSEYFEYLNEPGSFDAFSDNIKDGQTQLLEINLLVDAYHAIYESRYSEAVINCLTAIELHIYPLLRDWLKDRFLNKNEKNAQDVLLDISTATKFELLFGTIEEKLLGKQQKLLEQLKGINKLRNEIIHKGKRANKIEANNCLNVSSKFIMVLFFKVELEDHE